MARSGCKFDTRGRRHWRTAPARPILKRRVKRRLLLSLTPALVAGALLPSLARPASRAFLFPAAEVPLLAPPDGFVRHALRAADGVAVHALELPAPPGARTVVHFHNNRETAEAPAELARALRA